VALLASIAALVAAGLRIAPPQQASNSAESRQACKREAPDALKSAGAYWCAIGLFAQVNITETDEQNVLAVMNFSPNGAQAWQIQSTGLINEFRTLTDRLARDAGGRNVSVDIHNSIDKRIAVCARLTADKMAACEAK
jgi:hypothetical protein